MQIANDFNMQTCNLDEEHKSEWEDEFTISGQQNFLFLEYKKKVVEMVRTHSKWSLETLQK